MALSATISLSPTTTIINQQTTAFVTITNSIATPVNIIAFTPIATVTGGAVSTYPACALGVVDLGPGAITMVPASGTLSFSFGATFFAPSTGPIGAGTGTYSVGCVIVGADGSVFSPTAATLTVNPIAQPTSEQ
jgi:hypothetical protein